MLQLPPVQSAQLDSAKLRSLLFDIEQYGQGLQVRVKAAMGAHASPDETWTLRRAVEALEAQSILGIQLRYNHQGKEWLDTLTREGSSVRLVRISPLTEQPPPD